MKKQIFNPFLPEGEYFPDGEPHVFGDRVYLYSSHDKCGALRYCPGDYVFWSADVRDPRTWTNNGVSYRRRGKFNPLGFKCMWAPDCARGADGRYYLYYSFGFENRICVAVSDSPDRGFTFHGVVHHPDGTVYGKGAEDIMCFDPAVLADDDGSVWLYSGYSANEDLRRMLRRRGIKNVDGTGAQVVRLDPKDMLTVVGKPKMSIPGYKNSAGTGFEGHEMYEGSSIRKINGRYYFIYSSRLSHELAYAVSDRPDGPFRYGGAIVSNGDIGYHGRAQKDAVQYWGNIHGSVERIGDKYYVFYHRQTNKNEQSRQACAEEIVIAEDGSIAQVEMTSCGLNGGPLAGEGYYPAYIACELTSAKGAVKCAYGPFSRHKYAEHPCITEYAPRRQCIKGMRNGAIAGYKYFDVPGKLTISAITRGSGGRLYVATERGGGYRAALDVPASGKWTVCSAEADLPPGKTALYFVFEGKGSIDLLGFELKPKD